MGVRWPTKRGETVTIKIFADCRGYSPHDLWVAIKPLVLKKSQGVPMQDITISFVDVPNSAYMEEVVTHGKALVKDEWLGKHFANVVLVYKRTGKETYLQHNPQKEQTK